MVGSEGLTKPTDAQLNGLRDAIEWLRKDGGAGTEIKGHKDGYPTQCPGPALYAWVKKGAPRPAASGGGTPAPSKPAKLPTVSLAKLVKAAKADPKAAQGHQTYAAGVRLVEKALREFGSLGATYATDGSFGTVTVTAYAAWQRHLGYAGADADGIPGKTSLVRLGQTTGLFTVTT
jgi:hypothetical protein